MLARFGLLLGIGVTAKRRAVVVDDGSPYVVTDYVAADYFTP